MDQNNPTPTPVQPVAPQPVTPIPVATPVQPVAAPMSPPAGGQEAFVMSTKKHFPVAIVVVILIIAVIVGGSAYWYMQYQQQNAKYIAPTGEAPSSMPVAPTAVPTPGIQSLQTDLNAVPVASVEASFTQVDQDIKGL